MPIISYLKSVMTPLMVLVVAGVIGPWGNSRAMAMQPDASLPHEVEQGWWGQAQKDIAASEYHVTMQKNGLQAPNRRQNLRTSFDEAGALSAPRTVESQDSPSWQWGLQLAQYGWKDGEMQQPASARPQWEKNIVTYQRGANLREWYVNSPEGVKSWFTLKEKPLGSGDTLRLELELRGNTLAKAAAGGQSIDFTTPDGGQVINYSGLKAWDADGTELTCALGLKGNVVVLDIEVGSAVFPVTIDPMATTPAWTVDSDQFDSYFGGSVASAGDVNGDGYADVIVGALYYDNGQTDEGRAFLYYGSSLGLASTTTWTVESNKHYAYFGCSVASAGDVNGDGYSDVIVGAYNDYNGQLFDGRAYVYMGSSTGLASTAAWTVESNQDDSDFGRSVASAGDINGDGYSDVLVGAPTFDNGEADEGRTYLYLGSHSGLAFTSAWTAEGNQANANFGWCVASAGDVNGDDYSDVIVGAQSFDNGQTDEGRAIVYMGSAVGLASTATWTAESNQANALFGISVASAGDVNGDGYSDVIIGAVQFESEMSQSDEGGAFVYMGSASGLASTPAWTTDSNHVWGFLGYSVASAGDVNGDGYSDIIVGAPGIDNDQTDQGRIYVHLSSAAGLDHADPWTVKGKLYGGQLGYCVASAGDVNGDGFSDVIVGECGFFSAHSNVFLGAPDYTNAADWQLFE